MHTFDPLCVNPATLNGMLLYYRLMTKSSGFGDSTKLSRVGLSHKDHKSGMWHLVMQRGLSSPGDAL
jgi:hypothetical protein